jgi:hypothetical protein
VVESPAVVCTLVDGSRLMRPRPGGRQAPLCKPPVTPP